MVVTTRFLNPGYTRRTHVKCDENWMMPTDPSSPRKPAYVSAQKSTVMVTVLFSQSCVVLPTENGVEDCSLHDVNVFRLISRGPP